jgi:hypothetical protein
MKKETYIDKSRNVSFPFSASRTALTTVSENVQLDNLIVSTEGLSATQKMDINSSRI